MMMTAERREGRPVLALGLIGIGVLVFLGQLTGFGGMFSTFWPLFVAVPGLVFLYFAYTGDRKISGLAVPGTVITGTGLILFYQNITGHWESWAYAWTLYPLFVGLALRFMAQRTGSSDEQKASSILMRIGAIGFIVGAIFFELIVFEHGGIFGNLALPLVLVAIGAFMLFGNKKNRFTQAYAGKRKMDDFYSNGKYKNSDRLQQQIDEALAEDDKPTPVV
ncbi:MAG: hypothetical protein H0X30_36390 [Anaerolineae bacterium]|nr:hypothetical protein [Anaerolineae bacterium]